MREFRLAGTRATMVSAAVLGLAAWPAAPQSPPSPEYLTQLSARLGPIEQRLKDANGDVMVGPNTRRTAVNRCDPEEMKAAIAELEAIARETKLFADGAALSGEFGTVDPEVAADANTYVQSSLRMWRQWLEHCLKRTQTATAQPQQPAARVSSPDANEGILDELGDDIGATKTGLPPKPPAVEPRTAPPPPPPRKPEDVHVPPKPVASMPELPNPLESMIRETDSRQRYLELRRMAEPGAIRPRVPPLESILDEIDDEIAVKTVQSCGAALKKVPPPFAAAVLAAGSRAVEKPDHWFPGPDLSDTRAAAEACEKLDEATSRVAELREELRIALLWDVFPFGGRNPNVRESYVVEQELKAAQKVELDLTSQRFLNAHNEERAEVGVAPLVWDHALAAGAKAYAVQLTSAGQLVHSPRTGRKDIRENLLQSLPGQGPEQMIGVWRAEKRYFRPGLFPDVSSTGNWYDIGHYTQMIWETNTHVGCASHGDARFTWLVCHYSPGGNKDGKPVGIRPAQAVPAPPPPP